MSNQITVTDYGISDPEFRELDKDITAGYERFKKKMALRGISFIEDDFKSKVGRPSKRRKEFLEA